MCIGRAKRDTHIFHNLLSYYNVVGKLGKLGVFVFFDVTVFFETLDFAVFF